MFEKLKKVFMKAKQLDTLMNFIPVLIYMKDKNKNLVLGSKFAEDFVIEGYDKHEENVQLNMPQVQDLTEFEDNWTLDGHSIMKEKKAFDKEGNPHYYRVYKEPVWSRGKVEGLITIAKNIDAEKQLQAQQELFVAMLTHDIKNPLYAQKGIIEYLIESGIRKDILEPLLESQNYLIHLLETMLLTYKLDYENLQLERETFNVRDLMLEAVSNFKVMMEEKGISCELNLQDFYVTADKTLITRVLHNLLSNAIAYGKEKTQLEAIIKPNKIGVKNNSIIIPEHVKKVMFNKYVTFEKEFRNINVGLGLYICKQIVELHKGEIWLESDNEVNTVWFSFDKEHLIENE